MESPSLPGSVCSAVQTTAVVVEQERMARDTFRLRLRCPDVASQIRPGQFFMLRAPRRDDPLLGRPFALYDVYENERGQREGVDFGYVVIGKLTGLLAGLAPGDELELWGPLGNGFPEPGGGHLMIVAGGIGQTPFLAVVREALGLREYGAPPRALTARPDRITMLYGVRSREYLAGVDDFAMEGLDFRVATDDGTAGHRGFVTELLETALAGEERPDRVFCCGPEPMMHRVQELCGESGVPCRLSLESPMACGFGACFSCVVRVRMEDGGWDYRRSCVEGPVFDGARLVLD